MARKLITATLTPLELKVLRAVPFIQRNKIIQDRLDQKMKLKIIKLRLEETARRVVRARIRNGRERFIF